MALTDPIIFGKTIGGYPTPTNYQGLTNWYQVPNSWFCRRNANGTVSASPNQDFSSPVYDVKTDSDGYMKIQDLFWNAQVTPN
jgi:hypothetical protein